MPELKSDEAQAERKKRRTAEKEASRWRKKAAELQELVEQLQQHSQQPQLLVAQACICHTLQMQHEDVYTIPRPSINTCWQEGETCWRCTILALSSSNSQHLCQQHLPEAQSYQHKFLLAAPQKDICNIASVLR